MTASLSGSPARSDSSVRTAIRSGSTAAHCARVSSLGCSRSGTMIGIVPAAKAAAMPTPESSTATQAPGAMPSCCAASR